VRNFKTFDPFFVFGKEINGIGEIYIMNLIDRDIFGSRSLLSFIESVTYQSSLYQIPRTNKWM